MELSFAYSAASAPSMERISAALLERGHTVTAVRDSSTPVFINWGRASSSATLNADTSGVTNKRVMRESFRLAGVAMPTLYQSDAVTFPAVGRPDKHTRCHGFWLVTNERELRRAMRGRTFRNGTHKVGATHFMEYIPKERAPYEYRVHVFMGRVIRVSLKDFDNATPGNHYLTVSAQGSNTEHVKAAAIQAVAALGLDFGAVDIAASDTEAFVFEVNTAPGLGGTMPDLYAKVFARWARGQR